MKPKTKVKRGRTSLLTRALQTEICKLLQQGSSIKSSCFICDVGERTFYDWRDKGRRGEEPFACFFSAVTRAREEHKAKLIQRIVAAAKADWKAASWLLERQFVSEFGRSEHRTIVIDRPPPPVAPVEQPSGATFTGQRKVTKSRSPASSSSTSHSCEVSIRRRHGRKRMEKRNHK